MTTANLMNVPSVKGNVSVQIEASKKLQEESLEVAEIFAGIMNQTIDFPDSMMDDTSSNKDVSKTDSVETPATSYERYSYKENSIETAQEPTVEERAEEAGEALEEAGDTVMDTLCETYGVDEETVQTLLDDMGLSVLDLLNPQNLVSFMMQLTGANSGEELLLDENFLSVMETINHLAEGLMKDLNVDRSGLQELVSQMELVTNDTDVSVDFQSVLDAALNEEVFQPVADEAEGMAVSETADATAVDENQVVEMSEMVDKLPEETQETKEAKETKSDVSADATQTETETKKVWESNETSREGFSFQSQTNETVVQTQSTTLNQVSNGQMVQQFSSYLSADTVQIMEQIVQQMRVTISTEITTMEMQLNPENLGKVYVNISSEEGVVNAQFHATNEVVKEALEAQVATLRESLNQAGVKVDAIEVTIASHEFERNLEQNHQNPEETVEAQEANTKKRRNLNLESLDELSGVMTEEETLVAQMMKDNGNSVDFTA